MKAHDEAMAMRRQSLGIADRSAVDSVSEPPEEWDDRVRCIDCRGLRGIWCTTPKAAGLQQTHASGAETSASFRTLRQRCAGFVRSAKSQAGGAPCRG